MIRTENYLGGRLVKEISQVNMGPTASKPYDQWVDGRYRWLLFGSEITEDEARGLLKSVVTQSELDQIASILHAELCDGTRTCRRWDNTPSGHRSYYYDKALNITTRLGPGIGTANVILAVTVILDEIS